MPVSIPDAFLERMAEKFRMLADPTRIAILRALMEGEKNVGQVVTETGKGQANVSKHLKMLAESGLVRRRKDGLQVFYVISDPLIEKLCEMVCGTILDEARSQAEQSQEILKTWEERV